MGAGNCCGFGRSQGEQHILRADHGLDMKRAGDDSEAAGEGRWSKLRTHVKESNKKVLWLQDAIMLTHMFSNDELSLHALSSRPSTWDQQTTQRCLGSLKIPGDAKARLLAAAEKHQLTGEALLSEDAEAVLGPLGAEEAEELKVLRRRLNWLECTQHTVQEQAGAQVCVSCAAEDRAQGQALCDAINTQAAAGSTGGLRVKLLLDCTERAAAASAIAEGVVLVVLLSAASVLCDAVLEEVTYAVERGKAVVPVHHTDLSLIHISEPTRPY
eukprot:TRINITY_DN17953_c0_g2_i2.p1 TRINITY_DN17953_c0_g2~~TRINITY_DN17953_c0_g2_i2.p1  ORF type:complete len:271 (+),score=98.02 TRINITY_DN17953_c0_g2_i2:180-992(+)